MSNFKIFILSVVLISQAVGQCPNRFKAINSRHSMCPESRDTALKKETMTDAIKKIILDEHNKYRGKVNPPAKYMFKMVWDDEAAKVALGWARQCGAGEAHDKNMARFIPGRSAYGQNVASFGPSGTGSWTQAIKAWHDEVKDFRYDLGSDDSGRGDSTGHYTQVVWADSNRVGCGMATCKDGDVYICNYGPPGNEPGKYGKKERPYFRSTSQGSDCGSHFNAATGLCDCGDTVCLNGGRLNPKTCKCDCTHWATKKAIPWLKGPSCELDCSKITAEDSRAQCSNYECQTTEIFDTCPITCNLCPMASGRYKVGLEKDSKSYIGEAATIFAEQPGGSSGNVVNGGSSGNSKPVITGNSVTNGNTGASNTGDVNAGNSGVGNSGNSGNGNSGNSGNENSDSNENVDSGNNINGNSGESENTGDGNDNWSDGDGDNTGDWNDNWGDGDGDNTGDWNDNWGDG